ncbi:MAG TPA: hypothetical protein VKA64_05865 [Gammaproteobacteria bacterium]|nr:hypothetical protein [Gammaproteobacteria bacterium]
MKADWQRGTEPVYTRHQEVPVFEYRDSALEAGRYNRVQVALKRLGEGLRLELPELKHLEFILQRDAWVVVDTDLEDLPVLAWTDFQVEGRAALHEPVPCRLRLYHANAGLLIKTVLGAMDTILERRLDRLAPEGDAEVTPLKGTEPDDGG